MIESLLDFLRAMASLDIQRADKIASTVLVSGLMDWDFI